MGIHENEWDFVAWNLKKLFERAAKYTAVRSVEFAFKGVFYQQIYSCELTFFLFEQ